MQPTSLKKAIQFASAHYGLKASLNREELVDKVNMVRHAFWKNEAMRALVFKDQGCACVEQYSGACHSGKSAGHLGVTLPHGVTNVQHLSFGDIPISITEQEVVDRRCGAGKLEAEVQTMRAPLLREIPADYRGKIIIKANDPADNGARVGVEYVTPGGVLIREDILATAAGPETTQPCSRFINVVMPDRAGYIQLLTVDGWELGSYHPAVLVPSHLRVRIRGLKCGDIVNWQGLKEPQNVLFDTDRVEFSAKVDWMNAFNWIDAHLKPTKTKDDVIQLQFATAYAQSGAAQELSSTHHKPLKGLVPRGIRNLSNRMKSFH